MKATEKQAIKNWFSYHKDLAESTHIDVSMSYTDIQMHKAKIERDPIEWMTYFFPKYASYPFAPFQRMAVKRIVENNEWFEVLSWSRSLAKSTVTMMTVLYLTLTGRKKNVILTSNSKDNAVRLLDPYRANLEGNGRLIAYYGEQMSLGSWKEDEFITKSGIAFRALGAGQSPRGSRNEAFRPDIFLVDDFDTDEDCRNPDIIEKRWDWWERALYPCRDPATPTLTIFCGNIIAKDCCVVRAAKMANHHDVINIRDKNGHSSWPEKNSEEAIDATLSKISTKAAQGEYFNNPISDGEVFKNCLFGKIPPLHKFKFLVAYGDPAPSENKSKASSTKAVWLCGKLNGVLYIIKGFLDRGLNKDFIEWYVQLNDYVEERTNIYNYMENNKLQDPFFQQVFKPIVAERRKELEKEGKTLNILADTKKKTDKATRIEANLEPLSRLGKLVFNEKEKDCPHMKRLVDQFLLFSLNLKYPADGPDCIEGANRIIDDKFYSDRPIDVIATKKIAHKNSRRL